MEKVYENALAFDLRASRLLVAQQFGVRVPYKDVVVDDCIVDPLDEAALLVELKTVKVFGRRTSECNASLVSIRPACCSISATGAWRSNAWSTIREPCSEPY